jgi:hypothetical protein
MRFTPQRFALQTAGFRKKRCRLLAKHAATSSDVSSFSTDRSVSNQVRHFALLVTGMRVHRTKTPAFRETRRYILPSAGTGTRSTPERASGCVRRSIWSRRFPEELRTARDNRESCKSKKGKRENLCRVSFPAFRDLSVTRTREVANLVPKPEYRNTRIWLLTRCQFPFQGVGKRSCRHKKVSLRATTGRTSGAKDRAVSPELPMSCSIPLLLMLVLEARCSNERGPRSPSYEGRDGGSISRAER